MQKKKIAAVVMATALVGGLAACSSEQGGEQDVVRVALANHSWTTLMQDHIAEFEAETGKRVDLTVLGEVQLSDQYNVKLNTQSSEFDVMMYRPLQEALLFDANGWLSDLSDYAAKDAEWDVSDYSASGLEGLTFDDRLVGIPFLSEHHILYYRKDLLAAAGLEVPTTFEELETAARIIQESNDGIYGFVSAGQRVASVTRFSSYLFGFGGDFTNADGTSALNTPEARAAYDYYSRMLRLYGPEGVTNMEWSHAMAVFAQGQVAFFTEADVSHPAVLDPNNSKVADTVGFAPMPGGPAGKRPFGIASWALGINQYSNNKDGAWEFISWITNKENVLTAQQGGLPGFRTSVWLNPDSFAGAPADYVQALMETIEGSDVAPRDRPKVINMVPAREIVGGPIVDGILGTADLDKSIADAHEAFNEFLKSDR